MKGKNSVRRRAAFAAVVLAGVTLAGMAAIPASALTLAGPAESRELGWDLRETEPEANADLPALQRHCRNNVFGRDGGESVHSRVEVRQTKKAETPAGPTTVKGYQAIVDCRKKPTNIDRLKNLRGPGV